MNANETARMFEGTRRSMKQEIRRRIILAKRFRGYANDSPNRWKDTNPRVLRNTAASHLNRAGRLYRLLVAHLI